MTHIARQVLAHIPAAEAWTAQQIAIAIQRGNGGRIDEYTLLGALQELAGAGLVRVASDGTYRRAG